jgi:hypothetical protein
MAQGNANQMFAEPKSLMKVAIKPTEIHLKRSESHSGHFLDCIRTREESVAPPEVAHRSTTLCLLADTAMRLGRKLRWDPDKEEFVGDAEANRTLSRAMRAPWQV